MNYPSYLDSTNTLTGYKSIPNYKDGKQASGALTLTLESLNA